MGTASVIRSTLRVTLWLPHWVIYTDIHGRIQLDGYTGQIVAIEFVGFVDALCFPVGPVDPVFEYSDGEGVFDVGV